MFVSFVPLNYNDYVSLFNMHFFVKVHEIEMFKMLYLVLFETSVILKMLHKKGMDVFGCCARGSCRTNYDYG